MHKYTPLISVVIPVYNGAKTIKETIESVLQQTYENFEIIVINDGSQDETLAIVKSVQDQRIKVFSYPNAGLSASRNRGFARACGEFIAFLDADDLWTKDKLAAQLAALQQNPQAAVAYSWTDHIDENSKFLRPASYNSCNGNVYERLLIGNFLVCGSNTLIRAQALTKVGGFDESLNSAEDWDMWLRLAPGHEFVVVPRPQVLYRISPYSMSANISKMEVASLQVLERAYSQAPKALQHRKKETLGFIYKFLMDKALQDSVRSQRGLKAAKVLLHYLRTDESLFHSRRLKLILLSKVITANLFPFYQTRITW
ncbi:glycosyltransferase [Aliterella atlantica]|uniref:Glycosyl transferase family A n=1 Tax=Aliterella atlantica CENA595 TaxID=1618023 RepID=A0A0D8ZVJ9_9CYAN|nr:glycosyltransferase [Aliterella atlantica]KJH72494.1 glycosyl transferase family A [Aliterella atlantica CENA595]